MTRLLQALALVLLAGGLAASDQPFASAKPKGRDVLGPKAFSFTAGQWKCVVTRDGAGTCREGLRKWTFRLPVADGRIDSLDWNAGPTFVLVYTLSDEESAWGMAVCLVPHQRRTRWATQVGGLNRAVPIATDSSVLVAAVGFIASLDRRSGEFAWRHELADDDSGRTDVSMLVDREVVALTATTPGEPGDSVMTCYSVESGMVVPCSKKRGV